MRPTTRSCFPELRAEHLRGYLYELRGGDQIIRENNPTSAALVSRAAFTMSSGEMSRPRPVPRQP